MQHAAATSSKSTRITLTGMFALLQSLSHHCTTENEQENGVIRVQHGVVIFINITETWELKR